MKRNFFLVLLPLLLCLGGTIGLERYDRQQLAQQRLDAIGRHLEAQSHQLQTILDQFVAQNRALAQDIGANPDLARDFDRVKASIAPLPQALSVVVAQRLQVVQVAPEQGNENLVGVDFGLHPEFMNSIKRAIDARNTVSNAPVQLLQNGRPGLIVYTPIFSTTTETGEPGFWGFISMAADLEELLTTTQLLDPSHEINLAIRNIRKDENGKVGQTIFGPENLFLSPHAKASINLPDGRWELGAAPRLKQDYSSSRAWLIRLSGLAIGLALLATILRRRGLLSRPARSQEEMSFADTARYQIPLRSLLLAVMLLPIPLLIGVSGWLSFAASIQAAEQLAQQQLDELALQIRDKTSGFFDVPRRVVAYNAAQIRHGQLDIEQPEKMQSNFLLQLRQQPLLTFLSVGTIEGEYYAASRPPLGTDKTLRILQSTRNHQLQMRLYRVDNANRPTKLFAVGNQHFDARTRPWYQATRAADSLRWYPAYRYAIDDAHGAYSAMGMGMAAPLYNADQKFVGVLTADVALSQLGSFLKRQVSNLDGTAFITETDGKLLASSGDEPVYRLEDNKTLRILAGESDNPVIHAAGQLIQQRQSSQGVEFVKIADNRHLVHWQTLQLPDGPALTIALTLPDSHFSEPAAEVFRNIAYLTLGFSILGIAAALFAADWLARPLDALSRWATQLRSGDWQAAPPSAKNPIAELSSLTYSLGTMADTLKHNTAELEARVAERTQALEIANRQLEALSSTDPLTGIANRRHFDRCVAAEWSRATRSQLPMTLMMLDVDWFKPYNDQYGHQAGDEALLAVARVLEQHTRRPGDLAARYGGEEFVIIAAHTDELNAQKQAEQIRAAVTALNIPHAGSPLEIITVSIGIATWRPGDRADVEKLLALADDALYRAKGEGRNRVTQASAA